MIRLRNTLVPLLADARDAAIFGAIALLFIACFAGRIVVAVAQDVREAARRMWE